MRHTYSGIVVLCTVFSVAVFVAAPLIRTMNVIGSEQVALVSQMGASISETQTNKLAAQLRDRANELNAREMALNVREATLREEQDNMAHHTRNVLAGTIGFSLIALLIVNVYIRKRAHDHLHDTAFVRNYTHSSVHTPRQSFSVDLHRIHHI